MNEENVIHELNWQRLTHTGPERMHASSRHEALECGGLRGTNKPGNELTRLDCDLFRSIGLHLKDKAYENHSH